MDKVTILKKINSLCKDTLMETLEIEFVDIGSDYLTAKMPVTSKVFQPYKQLHGGATAALVESVGSAASHYFLNDDTKKVNGIELSINQIKSKSDGWVLATAKMLHHGKSTDLWEVEVVDESNQLIAHGKLTNILLEKKS